MTTTDPDALKQRIARALFAGDLDGPSHFADADSWYQELAAAVLPIVAAEARKAKAEAWDRAYWQGVQDEIDSQGFDGGMTGPNRINPYCETGDSDERR